RILRLSERRSWRTALRGVHLRYEDLLVICSDFELAVLVAPPRPDVSGLGWLSRGMEYPSGPSAPEVFARLKALFQDPFQPFVAPGWHKCDLCQFDGTIGASNLFLPDG